MMMYVCQRYGNTSNTRTMRGGALVQKSKMQRVIDTSPHTQPTGHTECGNTHSHLAVTSGSAQLLGTCASLAPAKCKRVFRVNHRPTHEEQKHESPWISRNSHRKMCSC